jgi:hypothetical protein
MWKAGTSKVVAPPMSVKDWWVGPREQVLNVSIACRWYGSGKPSSWLLTEGGFTPTTSMASSGEKLGMDSRINQSTHCGLCREPFFLGAVSLSIVVDDFTKGCHIWGLPVGSVRQAYVDWRGKRTYRVGQVFPCRVYIDSNRRDSRIWVTACSWQSSRS